MAEYSKDELEEAKTALTSTLQKCEKIDEAKKLGKSQQTLLDRRIRALRLALDLIERENLH
jgi:F0F1-type ATP synthase assembly protein I